VAKRSDTKQRMVAAAEQLIREHGYGATAFADVLERSGAPRGSVYFHFPQGKQQLGVEAVEAHAHRQVGYIDDVAEQASSPVEFVQVYLDLARDGMTASGYSRGCGIAPLVIESPEDEGDLLRETTRRAFTEMTDRLTFHFVAYGVARKASRELAEALLAGLEGALITARAMRSPAVFESVRSAMSSYAETLTRR
jgi:TetR/AcrR family transcriptional regulator, lmrAB and yxaGH operons repressor